MRAPVLSVNFSLGRPVVCNATGAGCTPEFFLFWTVVGLSKECISRCGCVGVRLDAHACHGSKLLRLLVVTQDGLQLAAVSPLHCTISQMVMVIVASMVRRWHACSLLRQLTELMLVGDNLDEQPAGHLGYLFRL